VSEFFANLGRQLGRKAVPTIRKSKWIWDGLAGTDEESLRAEAELGSVMANELRAIAQPVHDPLLVTLLDDVCQRLSVCVRNNRRNFRCELFHDSSPNAMALPGGFIFISNSLVNLCDRNPDQLAFVIGHEMAHVVRRHVWERMLNEAVLRFASVVTSRAGALGGWFRQHGIALLRSGYSQETELEADELGVRLAKAAGFAPSGTMVFLQRIRGLERTPIELGQYFRSHPPAVDRMARLASLVGYSIGSMP